MHVIWWRMPTVLVLAFAPEPAFEPAAAAAAAAAAEASEQRLVPQPMHFGLG